MGPAMLDIHISSNQDVQNIPQKIFILGLQNLQNSILIGVISQQTQIECCLLNNFGSDTSNLLDRLSTLILIDADSISYEKAAHFLDTLNQLTNPPSVALINCRQNSSHEQLMAWPQVNGIFNRDTPQDKLVKGITGILEGEYWLSRKLLNSYLEQTRHKPKRSDAGAALLTKREKQILRLTATGATNTQIADHLSVSMHTVKTHIYNLFKKINVTNRIQAINWAQEHLDGLVQEAI
jgi:LuxR family transcriptional regulator of csgAB operon